jgi:cyclopropane-fatty-acyl-phospholipid synthase
VLKPGGLFLLHTVGSNVSVRRNDRWFDRYIFPNSMLPSIAQIGRAIEGLFTMEDWHNFGHDYSRTLAAWYEQFERSWPGPRDDSFYRMWKYYLLCSAGQFSSRRVQLWQLVLAREGVRGGYRSIR